MFSKAYLMDLAERSVATFVQAAAAAVIYFGTIDLVTLKLAAIAGALSVAKSLAARGTRDPESASLVK